jgi:HSP20 family protein
MANRKRTTSVGELRRGPRQLADFLARSLREALRGIAGAAGIHPAVESLVQGDELVIRADLPGLDPEQLETSVQGDALTIRGARKPDRDEARRKGRYLHREIAYGTFERQIQLPPGTDAEAIEATYRNGVLEIRAPVLLVGRRPLLVRSETASQRVRVRAARKARTTAA